MIGSLRALGIPAGGWCPHDRRAEDGVIEARKVDGAWVAYHCVGVTGLAHAVQVDSAGTYAGHQGEKPDRRAMALAKSRGYAQIEKLRARRVREEDFERFDLILVMDDLNMDRMRFACPREHQHKLHLFLDYAGVEAGGEVPDPYYGNLAGFERVLALCEAGARGVLDRLTTSAR